MENIKNVNTKLLTTKELAQDKKLEISVKEAAELIGKSQTFIREGLARGLLPFGIGFAVKEGSKKRTFSISRKKFYEYYGIEEER